jgi:cyclic GMP-AMP synthase
MDWDLGHYLPISVWEDSRPKVAASVYYRLLEGLLESLCKREGWTLSPEEKCVRVRIGRHSHIDVPPYAAPDKEFAAIQERVLAKALALKEARDAAAVFGELPEADWDTMKEIMLATRSGEWRPSDPGVVSDWFRHQIEVHREQLRRICRYLKGWRDFQWREGGPSSVSLMICVCQTFQTMQGRDDLALLEVARELGDKLAGDIREELINDKEDFNKLSPQERIDAAQKARALYAVLKRGVEANRSEKIEVLKALRAQFGPRMPFQPDWIFGDTPQAVVKAAPAVIVPQPEVSRTRSG